MFTGINVGFWMQNNHVFACLVFVLQSSLVAGNTIPKWSPRSCLGLNLGPSLNHARNVNLVLNLNTSLVSPQFHCRFNDFFETTKHSEQDVMTLANLKQLTGYVKYDGSPTMQDKLSSADNLVVPVGTSPMESLQDPLPDDDFEISHNSHKSMQVSEGDIALESHDEIIAPSASTSSRG